MKWLRRLAIVLIFLVVDILAPSLIIDSSAGIVRQARDPLLPVFCVLVIFFADVTVLKMLSNIDGPLKADVKATIKRFGGSIWVTGGGLLGAFLAIGLLAFGGVYLFAKLFS